jgi:hypothetical protein
MPSFLEPSASQATSFRLAWRLFLGAIPIAAAYLTWPHSSAQYVIPAFVAIHGIVCLWAAQQAFAGSGPASGCMPGVVLWIAGSLEAMFLFGVWLRAVGGPY